MNVEQIEELMRVKVEELKDLLEKRREAALKDCQIKPGDVVITSKGEFIGVVDISVRNWETRVDKLLDEDPLLVIIEYFYLCYDKLSKNELSCTIKELSDLKRVGTFTYNKDTLVLESLNIVNHE